MQKYVPTDLKMKSQVHNLLFQSLAETSIVTLKAQNFHWNVEGLAFKPLHDLFQEIYEDHFEAQDALAERLRSLDVLIEGTYAAFLDASSITEAATGETAERMISLLLADQEQLSNTLRALAEAAEASGDIVTNDLAVGRIYLHAKFAWMLRAHSPR